MPSRQKGANQNGAPGTPVHNISKPAEKCYRADRICCAVGGTLNPAAPAAIRTPRISSASLGEQGKSPCPGPYKHGEVQLRAVHAFADAFQAVMLAEGAPHGHAPRQVQRFAYRFNRHMRLLFISCLSNLVYGKEQNVHIQSNNNFRMEEQTSNIGERNALHISLGPSECAGAAPSISDPTVELWGRIIDLTPAGSRALGFSGLAPVTIAKKQSFARDLTGTWQWCGSVLGGTNHCTADYSPPL